MASGIHIDPKNRGKFTARAASKGKSVQQQAKADATGAAGEKQRKRAQFAINARKWNKKGRKAKRSGRKSR